MQQFAGGSVPERFLAVDAARLMLVVTRFASPITLDLLGLRCYPPREVVGHFTPEYKLQKLDFLLRNPLYLAYELTELHRLGRAEAADGKRVVRIVREILARREPEFHTQPYRKFWRGAYERIDEVEVWWYSRGLIYAKIEEHGMAPAQKHYFTTSLAHSEAERLLAKVPHARWYGDRLDLIHAYFGAMSASEIKTLQYSHPTYRQAQLDELIPELPLTDLCDNFRAVFGEELDVEDAVA